MYLWNTYTWRSCMFWVRMIHPGIPLSSNAWMGKGEECLYTCSFILLRGSWGQADGSDMTLIQGGGWPIRHKFLNWSLLNLSSGFFTFSYTVTHFHVFFSHSRIRTHDPSIRAVEGSAHIWPRTIERKEYNSQTFLHSHGNSNCTDCREMAWRPSTEHGRIIWQSVAPTWDGVDGNECFEERN